MVPDASRAPPRDMAPRIAPSSPAAGPSSAGATDSYSMIIPTPSDKLLLQSFNFNGVLSSDVFQFDTCA